MKYCYINVIAFAVLGRGNTNRFELFVINFYDAYYFTMTRKAFLTVPERSMKGLGPFYEKKSSWNGQGQDKRDWNGLRNVYVHASKTKEWLYFFYYVRTWLTRPIYSRVDISRDSWICVSCLNHIIWYHVRNSIRKSISGKVLI